MPATTRSNPGGAGNVVYEVITKEGELVESFPADKLMDARKKAVEINGRVRYTKK